MENLKIDHVRFFNGKLMDAFLKAVAVPKYGLKIEKSIFWFFQFLTHILNFFQKNKNTQKFFTKF